MVNQAPETPVDGEPGSMGPVRKIPRSYRSVTGRAPGPSGKALMFESTLERDLLAVLRSDSTVKQIHPQPLRLKWTDETGREWPYTPDFLVEYRSAPSRLIEVKYRADFWKDWPRSKRRYRVARSFARENGWVFSIMTEVEIRGPQLENVVFLNGYLDRAIDQAQDEILMHTLAGLGEATPHALLLAAFAWQENRVRALSSLWRLIATRHILADLREPLTMQSAIWIDLKEIGL